MYEIKRTNMNRLLLLLTLYVFIVGCSKKSNDTPNPSSNLNAPQIDNDNKTTTLYDTLNVNFKGKNYYKIGSVGLLGSTTNNYMVVGASFGTMNTSTKPQFTFGLVLPKDSSKLIKLKIDTLNLRIAKGYNGAILTTYYHNSNYFFAGDTSRYLSGQIISNRMEGDRKQNKDNYSKITYLKYDGKYVLTNPYGVNQTYTKSIWLMKGDFNFVLYNENNFSDSTIVNGKFSIHITANPY